MTTAHILETADADIAYDLHGPLPTADGRPPLFMIGQPMTASGFDALVSHFPDRTAEAKGSGAGMAAFIAMTSWRGEFTDDYFAQLRADLGAFGLAPEDDGSRDDPLLSDRSWAVASYRPDVDALASGSARVVIAVGEESKGTFTGRTALATADLLGQKATVFPSHHGGFVGGEFGYPGQPKRSRANCATSSTTTEDRCATGRPDRRAVAQYVTVDPKKGAGWRLSWK